MSIYMVKGEGQVVPGATRRLLELPEAAKVEES